ncbi:MAG: hypothetical protein ABJB16_05375 [Saprospiraceae bacterium]
MGLFISSCQKDTATPDDGQKITNRDIQSFTYSLDSVSVGDSVLITFHLGTDADCGHVQIQVSGADGNGWHGGQPIAPDSGMATLMFVPSAPGEYLVRAKYTRTGKPSSCDYESTGWLLAPDPIIVGESENENPEEDSTSCDASFTGEVLICDSTAREVLYTFVSDVDQDHLKIKGVLTNGVVGDVEVSIVGADLDITQKTPGQSSNRLITLEGSVMACDTVFITVAWTSSKHDNVITGNWNGYGMTVAGLKCQ